MELRNGNDATAPLFEAVVASLGDGIILNNFENEVIYVNDALCAMTGYSVDDLCGGSAYQMLLPPSDWEAALQRKQQRQEGKSAQYETQIRRKDGSQFWALVRATPLRDGDGVAGMIASITDISERKQAEEYTHMLFRITAQTAKPIAVQIAEALGLVTETLGMQLGIVSRIEGETYTIEHVYDRERDIEPDRRLPLGLTYCHITLQESQVLAIHHMGSSKHRGHPCYQTFQLESYIGTALVVHGRQFGTLNFSSSERRDRPFTKTDLDFVELLARWVGSAIERQQAEAEARAAREKAERATRAKSQFLAHMSHEIRTPLNAIIGMTSVLLDFDLPAETRNAVEIIRRSGDGLLAVINDILDFSKIEAGQLDLELQPFDLRQCVEDALDLLASQASEKRIGLASLFADGTPAVVTGDVFRLRQILVNLIGNAVKFTSEGEVVVTVSHVELADQRCRLQFAVRDSGIGISADRQHRLFKAFSQADTSTTRQYGGTGLGLAICKRLAELMGGQVWLESELGVGSTFFFTIEVESVDDSRYAYLNVPLPHLVGRRVLIVDDNDTNRLILQKQTGAWGMISDRVDSGAAALANIDSGAEYDVVLLDIFMPHMDGVELSREIARRAPDLKQIALSSAAGYEEHAAEMRVVAYLKKPIRAAQLYITLNSVFSDRPLQRPAIQRPQPQIDRNLGKRHPLRILIAEDNPTNQRVALRLLDRLGYRAEVVGNGLEVMAALRRQQYDVVLMDIQMPEMDGVATTKQILATYPESRPRIVAMTANALSGDRERYLAAGMDDYIGKPVRVDALMAILLRVPATIVAGSPPIDMHVLREQYDDLAEEMARELVPFFVDEARELVARLVSLETPLAISQTAHALKGASGSVGAVALAELAARLEQAGKTDDREKGQALIEWIAAEVERVSGWMPDSEQ